MPKAKQKNIRKTKSRNSLREGLDLIDASHQRKMAPEPDLGRALIQRRTPDDVSGLVALYDAYMAAANAILGIENQPRAEAVLDLLEDEWNWLYLKAWTVAEHLKKLTPPSETEREGFARVLFDCALNMHGNLDMAQSVLRAAMAVRAAPDA